MSNILKRTKFRMRQNNPQILAGLGIVGVISTTYFAIRGTFQAAETIQLSNAEDDTWQEKAKLVWPHYIPTAVSGTATIGAIAGSNVLHGKRTAAAVGAYAITEQAFQEYRTKVREELGEHKEQVLRDDIVREKIEQNPANGLVIAGDGNVLCCELYTGRYFNSSMENLRQAANKVNHTVVNDIYATLDGFYDLLGLPHTSTSSELGWDSDRLMELEFSTVLSDDGKPCLAFNYNYIKPI